MSSSFWRALALTYLAGAALAAYSIFQAPRSLRIRRRSVPMARLPRAFHDYRILHISDIHLGALASGAEHVLAAAALSADLIVVTGDLVEDTRYADLAAPLLGLLRAPDGVKCVLGNHDHVPRGLHGGTRRLVELLAGHGIQTLTNDTLPLQRDGDRLWLVGVDDPYSNRSDPGKAFAGVPAGAPAILLAHSPDVMSQLPCGRADLVLTGHCHGGQVRTPWGPIFTRTRRKFPDVLGLQWVDGTPVHMSAGVGSTIPLRFLCPPEVTVLHLMAA
ncbi:MAG: hypothetical protein GEU73_03320 [Chloroflexi bacterium]|nr:hypothetical protein [Chloroflexota bacterium]